MKRAQRALRESVFALSLVLCGVSLVVLIPWSMRHTAAVLDSASTELESRISAVSHAQKHAIDELIGLERAVQRLRDDVTKLRNTVNNSLSGGGGADAFDGEQIRRPFDRMVHALGPNLEELRAIATSTTAQMRKMANKYRTGVRMLNIPQEGEVKKVSTGPLLGGVNVDAKFIVKWHGETGPRTSRDFHREDDAEAYYEEIGDFAKKMVSNKNGRWEVLKEYGDPKWLKLLTNDDLAPDGTKDHRPI